MVVHYPRTVWKICYAEHKGTAKSYPNIYIYIYIYIYLLFTPCRISLRLMSYVDLKESPCRHVGFKGQGPSMCFYSCMGHFNGAFVDNDTVL